MNPTTAEVSSDLSLFTIGVYGFSEAAFFEALSSRAIDTFCDVRMRRGLRGSKYAFANSRRLQTRLRELGIQYVHFKELAPSQTVRDRQRDDDQRKGISKRERSELGGAFVQAFQEECLANFDSSKFTSRLGPRARAIVLFCVEREPTACHRSLVAARLAADLKIQVNHITP